MNGDIVGYLEQVRLSAESDVVKVARYHARDHKADRGHFSTPRQVFCYVDHLGFIAYGGDSTPRSVRFIREYFPTRYQQFPELLYAMWRHGTVHQLKPYSYKAPLADDTGRAVEVRWLSTNHNRKIERAQHMLLFPVPDASDAVYLVVNGCQLADDLLLAIDAFANRVRSGDVDVQSCGRRIASVGTVREYTEVGRSVAVAVRDQIRLAWQVQGGRLDNKLCVVEAHPEVTR
jgi:hypothetical protein